jgi:hypothetical protein
MAVSFIGGENRRLERAHITMYRNRSFPVLQKRGLIGKGHVFKKYGYGYGLGVTFVKKGIVYEKRCELKDTTVFLFPSSIHIGLMIR